MLIQVNIDAVVFLPNTSMYVIRNHQENLAATHTYGHENEMYNVGLNLKEVECL